MNLPEVVQALLDHWEGAVRSAGFLFDQVVLDAAARLRSGEELLPGRLALAERDGVAVGLAPVLAVHAPNPAGVRLDPRDRIGARFETGPDVELEDEFLRRLLGEHVHRPLAVDRRPL